jgi:hypothetical protein
MSSGSLCRRRRRQQLIEATRARLAIWTPAHEVGWMAKPLAVDMIARHLDDALRAKRVPVRDHVLRIPATG